MAAYLEFPFTNAQWNELHRQAMIYKYMMASVPVPPGLLFLDPAASCPPYAEPGRCRRTDGKKWRCSRDAAPDKKYCERHMNRGRPRSRKPVELHVADRTNKKHRHAAHNDLHKAVAAFGSAATSPPHQESRSLNWMMKEPIFMDTADQEWQHMIKLKIGSPEIPFSNISTSVLHQDFRAEDHQTPNNCTHFVANEDERTKCNYLNLDMVSTDTPRGFIDAWSSSVSNDQNIVTANISNETIPLSSLTLSMGGCNSLEDEMGLNVHTAEDKERNGTKLDFSGWLSTTPGGPLAEVLRPHSSSVSNGVSNSSPSGGVVQNASLVSFSDSSQASSPTTLESSSHARTRAAMH